MDCILTNYPISRSFQLALSELTDTDVLRLSVTELRQRGLLGMLRYLLSLKVNKLYLPLEDENGSALLPVLKLIAAVVRSKQIIVVEPGMIEIPVHKMEAVFAFVKLLDASFRARLAVVKAKINARRLVAAPRIRIAPVLASRNFLYLNANLWFGVKAGGSVGHISGVVNAYLNDGYSVDFVSAGGALMVRPEAKYSRLMPAKNFGLPWEYNYYRFHYDVVRQLRGFEKSNLGFVYQRLSIANFSGVILSRKMRIPLILEYNGSEAWIARNWGRPLHQQELAERIEQVNLRHAHLIVTISDVLRDELLSRGVPANRIVTYPNCVEPEMFDPALFSSDDRIALRRRHGIAADSVVITFVGTFGQWHGADILARAIRLLIDKSGDWLIRNKVHFLLVGDGLKMADVKRIIGADANGPFVTLTGLVPQEEAPSYLAASDILASPHVSNADGSKFFGSPTKLFEYMAMGKAIVASDLDQIGQILENSVRLDVAEDCSKVAMLQRVAMLVKPGDADQLVEAITLLVEKPEVRDVLGQNARELALSKYTWRQHVAEIMAGLNGVLDAGDEDKK
jgi:glycosyltransferase involved in cell wall biosynthesis